MRTDFTALLVAGLASLVLAACGDDGSSDTASPSKSGASSAESAGLADAQKVVDEWSKPSPIGVEEPLKSSAPEGKTIVYLRCGVQDCTDIYNGMTKAGKTLGWNIKAINVGFTPEEFNKSFQAAIDMKPDGIATSGFPASIYKPLLEKTKASKTPVVTFASNDEATGLDGNGIVTTFNNAAETSHTGELLGNWIVTDSGGKDATVLGYNVAAYPTLGPGLEAAKKALESKCDSCSMEIIDVQATDIGSKLPQQVVSAVQQNPEVDYVVFPFGQMSVGVRAALDAAGFNDVKVGGQGIEPSNVEALKSGKEQAWMGFSTDAVGYYAMDGFARFFTDTPLEPAINAHLPTQIITEKNVGDMKDFAPSSLDADFRKLWQAG